VPSPRRFPPPWIAEETDACFIVRDASRQALAYVYFEEEPGRRSAAKLLTRDEARRIAVNIAKLPDTRNWQRPSLARRGASKGRHSSSGSLAMLGAMRRASSLGRQISDYQLPSAAFYVLAGGGPSTS
jgi:hypothetical protein